MYKLYCRIYQAIFKVGMYFIPWGMPKTLEGPGSLTKLPKLIKKNKINNVLVVTTEGSMKRGLLNPLFEEMKENKIDYVVFDGVHPNPTDTDVKRGLELFKKHNCKAIVAFGGGSAIDCAKAIGATFVKNKEVEKLQGLFKVLHKIPTLFAVPTTAGSGSETTVAAVITIESTHHKASMNDISLLPKYAVLDPALTVDVPPHITATTGMDALCHAVEAYTNNTYNSRKEKKLAEDAVMLIHDSLYTCYCDGNNIEARQKMQKASFYAGRAFTRGCVGYVHAIGHTLSGLYGISHGLAMSVILPHVMRQYGVAAHERLARLAEVCQITGKDDAEKAENFIQWIEESKRLMNIPAGFDMIDDKDINQIIKWAMKEANPLYPTPVTWKKKDFYKLIQTIRQI